MVFAVTTIAQSESSESDEQAVAILEKVSETFKSIDALKADFTMTVDIPDTDDDEFQEGTVYISGDSYKLQLEGHQIITDNNTLWTYLEEVNEVQVSYYEPDENTITPSQIFTIYEQDFSAFYIDKEKLGKKSYQQIDLTPRDKEKPYFKIKIWVNEVSNFIDKAVVLDKNGNKYIYEINALDKEVKLGEGFFSFDTSLYEDIEVIDLR